MASSCLILAQLFFCLHRFCLPIPTKRGPTFSALCLQIIPCNHARVLPTLNSSKSIWQMMASWKLICSQQPALEGNQTALHYIVHVQHWQTFKHDRSINTEGLISIVQHSLPNWLSDSSCDWPLHTHSLQQNLLPYIVIFLQFGRVQCFLQFLVTAA